MDAKQGLNTMDIITALKNSEYDLRISNGSKWLYCDYPYYIVVEKKPYVKNIKKLIITKIEEEAVKILLEDN
jgi:hypothetical protein